MVLEKSYGLVDIELVQFDPQKRDILKYRTDLGVLKMTPEEAFGFVLQKAPLIEFYGNLLVSEVCLSNHFSYRFGESKLPNYDPFVAENRPFVYGLAISEGNSTLSNIVSVDSIDAKLSLFELKPFNMLEKKWMATYLRHFSGIDFESFDSKDFLDVVNYLRRLD